ncbi:hypothetical protein [Actinocorallia libanotica]|uniref:DUF86 domain-containing protein n=1 Tax=Actinocorallia libanotica TaxID=46162 RepID=A0ABP4BZN4_9ACTN
MVEAASRLLRDVACWYLGEAGRERLKPCPDQVKIQEWESRCDFVLLERELLDVARYDELERIIAHYGALLSRLIEDYRADRH